MNYFARKLAGCGNDPPLKVEPGDQIMTKDHNLYQVVQDRFVRTGNLNAGYREFLIYWLNAPGDRRSTGWIAEHSLNSRDHFKITA